MLCPMAAGEWFRRRLWPGIAELGMALAALVVGELVASLLLSALPAQPWVLIRSPITVGLAAAFYGWVGPRWARAAEPVDAEPLDAERPVGPPVGLARAVAVTLTAIVAAIGGSMVLGYLVELLGVPVQEQETVLRIVQGSRTGWTLDAILLAVSTLLLAPVAEEWLFRGLLFRRIRGRAGRPMAYAISALAFGLIHFNPVGLPIYIWLGLVFAVTYERTGWLGAAMAVHLGNNAYVLALLFGGAGH